MDSKILIFALGVAAGMLPLLVAKLVSFFRAFAADTRSICQKMRCVESYAEYRHWKDELRCHYLCLIPFVNKKNVTRVYRFFFPGGDRAMAVERRSSVVLPLMPSILGICICMVCICSMTWAWYAANVPSPLQKMTVAHYAVTVESVTAEGVPVVSEKGGYALSAGTAYTVTLRADGTVQECGGYCLIESNESEATYYTQSILPGSSITVVFTPADTGTYTFTGVWGSHPLGVTEEDILKAAEGVEEIEATADTAPTDSTEPVTDPTDPTAETVVEEPPAEESNPAPTQETTPEESEATESTIATDPAEEPEPTEPSPTGE